MSRVCQSTSIFSTQAGLHKRKRRCRLGLLDLSDLVSPNPAKVESCLPEARLMRLLGAGHMAEGYARASGKPGVVLVTSGPGATNVITPIQDALSDGTPLVVFCGQVPTSAIGSDAFQEADVIGISRGETKPLHSPPPTKTSSSPTPFSLFHVGLLYSPLVVITVLIFLLKACTKWNTMVKTVAELPKKILEAFEIGKYTPLLCPRDISYYSQQLAGDLGPS